MEADEKRVPIPLLLVDAVGDDVIVGEGAVGLADDAAGERTDLLPGLRGQVSIFHARRVSRLSSSRQYELPTRPTLTKRGSRGEGLTARRARAVSLERKS